MSYNADLADMCVAWQHTKTCNPSHAACQVSFLQYSRELPMGYLPASQKMQNTFFDSHALCWRTFSSGQLVTC